MPYEKVLDLPKGVKDNLPKQAQEIYKEAFNSAVRRGEPRPPCRLERGGAEIREERERKLGLEGVGIPPTSERVPMSYRHSLGQWLL
jgi:cation transport regulator ChaB